MSSSSRAELGRDLGGTRHGVADGSGRGVFVTVGTTSFDALIQAVMEPQFLEVRWRGGGGG